jgi:hypothetical protein
MCRAFLHCAKSVPRAVSAASAISDFHGLLNRLDVHRFGQGERQAHRVGAAQAWLPPQRAVEPATEGCGVYGSRLAGKLLAVA